ncbi:MAG: hypothetical protein GY855_05790 [candidate division Zixibacteria bacterium]|nr:hypothetical protein [candidate division Zixibacteria bacterium]
MLNRKGPYVKLTIVVAVFVGIALINGCGNQSPVSPESTQTDDKVPFGTQQIENKWGRVHYFSFFGGVDGYVDQGGGSMEFEGESYTAEFEIAPGTVNEWTEIHCSISSYETENGLVYVFDFGPDGLAFNPPAKLRMDVRPFESYFDYYWGDWGYPDGSGGWDDPYDPYDPYSPPSGGGMYPPGGFGKEAGVDSLVVEGFELNYWNPDTQDWELIEFIEAVDGILEFNVEHFSRYGIGGRTQ